MQKIKHLLFCLAAGLVSTGTQAQYFPPATAATAVGASANVTKVSNDTRIIDVVAWDGSNPGFSYKLPSGSTFSVPLPAGFSKPDVAVAYPGSSITGDTYIIIVGILGSNFVCYRYVLPYGSSTVTLSYSNTAGIGTGSMLPSINVDADFNGNFAVAAGNPNGAIRVYKGTFTTLTTPAPWAVVGTLPVNTGQSTDVCLNNSSLATPTNIRVSYLDGAATYVQTNSIPFAGGAFSGAATIAPVIAGINYKNPRIACPMVDQCSTAVADHFTVVYNKVNGSSSDICQYNSNPDGTTNTVVATGGIAPFPSPALSATTAGSPVITFAKNLMNYCYAAAAISWEMTGSSPNPLVAERINTNGTPYVPPVMPPDPPSYLGIAPAAATGARCLAMAGKNGNNIVQISYWYSGIIYNKTVQATAQAY